MQITKLIKARVYFKAKNGFDSRECMFSGDDLVFSTLELSAEVALVRQWDIIGAVITRIELILADTADLTAFSTPYPQSTGKAATGQILDVLA